MFVFRNYHRLEGTIDEEEILVFVEKELMLGKGRMVFKIRRRLKMLLEVHGHQTSPDTNFNFFFFSFFFFAVLGF
jgi:hypothetical protein